ncbi:DUF2062 domain-containing protein [Paenibacillus sp. N1-5-1-14]|uniref:DUF2062 domain-containing protein n=1 Tax=Paenibacillus radicibacter TaxID=2972488 RepID=UPI0021592059|nr:DUF2062 domain-containing protein [Paenibacillus radicibacter]MCR8644834.1 DUF2062 domain-containing protein [Paenibacillus radicibacter]
MLPKQLMTKKRNITWATTKRWFKYKWLQLQRAKNGPAYVAIGFSIGLAVEMFTLPTLGLAFFLIFPLIYMLRGSLVGALIGFVFGKVIYIPMSFLNKIVGAWLVPTSFKFYLVDHLPSFLAGFIRFSLELIVGGMADGLILGIIFYFPVMYMLKTTANRRKEKRRLRKAELANPIID